MATIIVEGIPEGLLARLKLAAAGNDRSLGREVVVQLVRSMGHPSASASGDAPSSCGGGPPRRCPVAAWQGATTVGWGGPAAGGEVKTRRS
jgi:hypothetical protein